jgi:hypothetical protein
LGSQQMTFVCYVKVTRKIQNISYWYVHPLDQMLSIELTRTDFYCSLYWILQQQSSDIYSNTNIKIV